MRLCLLASGTFTRCAGQYEACLRSACPTSARVDLLLTALLSCMPAFLVQGDRVEILIMTKDGVQRDELQLKLD